MVEGLGKILLFVQLPVLEAEVPRSFLLACFDFPSRNQNIHILREMNGRQSSHRMLYFQKLILHKKPCCVVSNVVKWRESGDYAFSVYCRWFGIVD